MVTEVTINDVRGQAMLNDLREALIGRGQMGDAATVLEDEFRLLLKQIITLTPPPGLGGEAREHGEASIKKDLSKIFTPINEEMVNVIGSQFGVEGIDQWITDTDGSHKHLIWDRLDATGSGIEDFHHAAQDRRGRTRNLKKKGASSGAWYSPYVVSLRDFAPYLQKILSHVGRRKAAWAQAYQSIGGSVQSWIGRHLPSPNGRIVKVLTNTDSPSITAGNSSPGIGADERIIKDAMRIRREAMTKRLRLILSGYSKDVANGIRVTNKARKSLPSAD